MKTRAILLVLIFACGLLCKTIVRSYDHLQLNSKHDLTWVKKTRQESSPEVAFSRIFKSKRRIEKGLSNQFVIASSTLLFFALTTVFKQLATTELNSIYPTSPFQPPQ